MRGPAGARRTAEINSSSDASENHLLDIRCFERSHARSAGQPAYSPVQPCGMTTPIFIADTSFVTAPTLC